MWRIVDMPADVVFSSQAVQMAKANVAADDGGMGPYLRYVARVKRVDVRWYRVWSVIVPEN